MIPRLQPIPHRRSHACARLSPQERQKPLWLLVLLLLMLVGCKVPGWEVVEESPPESRLLLQPGAQLGSYFVAGPVLAQERLFVTSTRFGVTRQLRSFQPRTGVELWRISLGHWTDCPFLNARDGQVIVGCGDSIQSFELETGLRQWHLPLSHKIERPLMVQEGVLVVVTRVDEGHLELLALRTLHGEVLFQQPLETGASVRRVKNIVLIQSQDHLTALELPSGKTLWQQPWKSPLAEMFSSSTGVFTLAPEGIEGLDLETGKQRWFRGTDWRVSPAVLEGLLTYAQAGMLYGVDVETGKEKWSQRLAGAIRAPLLTHDEVYVHTAGGALRVLSAADGEERWTLTIGPPGNVSALNDQFYVWSEGEKLHAVDLAQRRLLNPIELMDTGAEGANRWLLSGSDVASVGSFTNNFSSLGGVSAGGATGVDASAADTANTELWGYRARQVLRLDGGRLFGIQPSNRLFMIPLTEE